MCLMSGELKGIKKVKKNVQMIGADVQHTQVFTPVEEQSLWDSGVLGVKSLQRAVFFYIGKRFCIRGGEEQRSLGPSQFVRSTAPN